MHKGSGAATGTGSRAITASEEAMGAAAANSDTLMVLDRASTNVELMDLRHARVKVTMIFEYMAYVLSARRKDKLGER